LFSHNTEFTQKVCVSSLAPVSLKQNHYYEPS